MGCCCFLGSTLSLLALILNLGFTMTNGSSSFSFLSSSSSAAAAAKKYVSAIGDPGMKSPNVRVALEAWNFCNEVGFEAPSMGSPRLADCADLYCPVTSDSLGAKLLDNRSRCEVHHKVKNSDNSLSAGDKFPISDFISYEDPDLFAVQKELYLATLCAVDEPPKPWQFWMVMLKNGNFDKNELNSLVELTTEKVETFLEGLLVNGWLSKLVNTRSYIEKSIAKWTFYLMLYSSKEELRASACDFWCNILLPQTEKLPIRIEWFPSYCELRSALKTYGFLFNYLSRTESIITNSGVRGPPKNIRAWIKFVAACCRVRSKRPVFSTSEAEELVEVAVFLSSDRQLEGLLVLLDEFVQSVISYFTDEEWNISCEKIARSISCRSPRDLNCLQTVECISGVSTRGNHLRSAISYQILLNCFDNKASNEEEILSFLISINVKDRSCDLFQMYIYLVLTENWLLSNPMFELKPVLYEMWGVYLRNCSCQITSTDMRPYASKVRTKASYILFGTTNK